MRVEHRTDAVGVGESLEGLRRGLGRPVGDDIIRRFVLGREFEQFDPAFAPIAMRFDEIGRAGLVGKFDVLVMVEIAVALDEAKPLDAGVGESRHGDDARRAQRAPDPFAAARVHQQSVGIMQFGPVIVGAFGAVFTVEEHRGQRRHADLDILPAREHRRRHFHHALYIGIKIETKGAGHGGTIEKGVNRRLLGRVLGGLDPEFAKEGEFLVIAAGRDRKASRGESIALAASEETEIAGAEEGHHFI